MKQFNYELTNPSEANNALNEVYHYTSSHPYKSILFHLYSIVFTDEQINLVQQTIQDIYPDASIGGTSSNGDICDGHLAEYGMVMAVSVFDSTDTIAHMYACALGKESEIGKAIRETIDTTPEIRAAEVLITLKTINSHKVLNEIEKCNKDVMIFGGGSANEDISETYTSVINATDVCHSGVLLITYAGNDFNIDIHHAIGWKPLGKDLTATRIEGKTLYELDDIPAAQIYSRYLDIQADDDFFANILEFPIMSTQHGQHVLRLPFSCNSEDGSILLAADLDKGTKVNLSYGDPDVIKGDVEALTYTVRDFAPQAIFLYSCGVRRLYWKYLINKETGPFSKIAPVSGFYSSGEIMRMDDYLIEHHVTLIAISMREGGFAKAQPTGNGDKKIEMSEEQKMHGQISMVRRLANFINVTAAELRAANEELQQMAETDSLTGLYNRRMLDNLVRLAVEHSNHLNINLIFGIIDIDDFKATNDTFGHAQGDIVLKELTSIAKEKIMTVKNGIIGRWGGEEFLFILPDTELSEAKELVDSIRIKISQTDFGEVGHKTISIGMTQYIQNESAEDVFHRADAALYEAKETGKNKLCIK
ncbi:sensor domain-containing diguanylate cyclase [Butyrivibrio sp. YAB3001]|uniref:sensor domain-containing diguanylate cyclase n=1 Tax=Butyrivibrio sp. YAB3001 TaxID=1520812 RepID=UPI0008F625C1|nr:diguanylate cyclase [Butyrivibrio sp. YAB3001]SFB74119.1 diguanylate cyclase (GGDEF) domain-containing protein [Butyrivibrio sp. YAB3001]